MQTWNGRHRSDRNERTLAVEAGQVVCPNRGVVDIEDCWICPAYRGLSTGPIEGLLCHARPAMSSSIVGAWRSYPAGIFKR